MDAEQFHTLMDEIKQSRDEIKELKREVSAVHERTTRGLAQKITKSLYQFKKKAHEIQFTFNNLSGGTTQWLLHALVCWMYGVGGVHTVEPLLTSPPN